MPKIRFGEEIFKNDEFRGLREMLHNHRVLRVAIIEDCIPLQFVEWVGR